MLRSFCGMTRLVYDRIAWYVRLMRVPDEMRWLFWEVDVEALDTDEQPNYILARVLEFGGIDEVIWALRTYGTERFYRFFRDVGHPELSARTLSFWRAFFDAEDETWAEPPAWRKNSAVPWPP